MTILRIIKAFITCALILVIKLIDAIFDNASDHFILNFALISWILKEKPFFHLTTIIVIIIWNELIIIMITLIASISQLLAQAPALTDRSWFHFIID